MRLLRRAGGRRALPCRRPYLRPGAGLGVDLRGVRDQRRSFGRSMKREPALPRVRLAVSKGEAAAPLGAAVDSLNEHALPDLRVVRRGRRVLVPVRELDRWLEDAAARTIEPR